MAGSCSYSYEPDHDDEPYGDHEKGGKQESESFVVNFVGEGAKNPWQSKGKGKGKSKFEGMYWNCGQAGHFLQRLSVAEGQMRGRGEEEQNEANGGFKGGWSQGVNLFDWEAVEGIHRQKCAPPPRNWTWPSPPFAPQPQLMTGATEHQRRLMLATWDAG